MTTENVLLFGLGGIGGVYACILHLSGKCNVHVVARSNYEAVKTKGFKLVSPKFGNHDNIKFAGGESPCPDKVLHRSISND
jgi:ketopantoate reductase